MAITRTWGHRVVPMEPSELGDKDVCERDGCRRPATHQIMYRYTADDQASGTTVERWCKDHARAFAAQNDVSCPPPNEPPASASAAFQITHGGT